MCDQIEIKSPVEGPEARALSTGVLLSHLRLLRRSNAASLFSIRSPCGARLALSATHEPLSKRLTPSAPCHYSAPI